MRVKTRPIEGEAAAWDPADPGPFLRLAGGQFLYRQGDCAFVKTREGTVLPASPGWLVIVPDGAAPGEAHFTPGNNLGTSAGCEWELAAPVTADPAP